MTFNKLLDKYRKISSSEHDKGNRFERLMKAYLLTDPQYANKLEKVWLWSEFPYRKYLGAVDTGVDLVAQTYDEEFWAIQCKCFQEGTYIDKAAVDSFLSTSSRTFRGADGIERKFAHRLWISTTNNWSSNAEEAIRNQTPSVSRINLYDLQQAPVDWGMIESGIYGETARISDRKLLGHQKDAIEKAHTHFLSADRGKLIMACGTGKTFTALRIAEKETENKGIILVLVPSIALVGQTLREWSTYATHPINAICVCSDPEISRTKAKNGDFGGDSIVDLALPASTNTKEILRQYNQITSHDRIGMTVIFSTYQSIDVVSEAQKGIKKQSLFSEGEYTSLPEFDLIICDEAHRTTGVTLSGEDESAFVKVHNNDFLKAKKRLYMTATPRLYSDESKSKAAKTNAILCSMDDPELYGEEIYRLGFGEAVEKDLLSDYKVLILTLNEKDVPPAVQSMFTNKENEVTSDDLSKLIGCINALSKQILGDNGVIKATDPEPMHRAVAFCQSIKVSKKITDTFNTATTAYIDSLPQDKREHMAIISSEHIDGTMGATKRDTLLNWLKDSTAPNECRILTNVRCLSEGVDVPSLDAVMFLSARNSQVDVVQSVGRVMRKADGKKYGYIIIPVVVPSDVEAEKALDNNERYRVVWTVLNALRAHDDRFNATINKIELNKKRPEQIIVGRPETTFDENGEPITDDNDRVRKEYIEQLTMRFEGLQNIIYARMVEKVGDRLYWEQWAKSVADIAERQIERINKLIKAGVAKAAFEEFLFGLQKNINPSITQQDAVEMLSQHTITNPIFEALFEGYSFAKDNPISVSMQKMMASIESQIIEEDTQTLKKFYDSVRTRASGIDNAQGKQRVIIELYNNFFKIAFPKMTERLGIVYTPVEVVDFIINSVADVLHKEFGRSISDENVNILDPFTGTGTFITRLIQSGLIRQTDLERKYNKEIFANEIVLLAYYIAAVNIENAYHDAMNADTYKPFEGICLTDTFQLSESEDLYAKTFPQNSERVQREKDTPITVIIGNPPYSVGQKSTNDNAQNMEYPKLDEQIKNTYAELSNATNKNALYDSYIRAFRWASDRLRGGDGIIGFVSNGAWLDGKSTVGFRKCLEKEFSKIYVFNLRGNQRTSGELSRREGGKIFGSGSRTPVAITLLIKKKSRQNGKAKIYYRDIGDYLNREEKLKILASAKSFLAPSMPQLRRITPNEYGDWIIERNDTFSEYIPLVFKKKFDKSAQSIFVSSSNGFQTNRDAWVYNFSKNAVSENMEKMVGFYNECIDNGEARNDEDKISWSSSLLIEFERKEYATFEKCKIREALYRPFVKQNVYHGEKMIHRRGKFNEFFPTADVENLVICTSGIGANKDFSVLITNTFIDVQCLANIKCFSLYYYEGNPVKAQISMFDESDPKERYIRKDGISDWILRRAREQYGSAIKKEDIFYYVYGFLHSPAYRETFANDLKKSLPRIIFTDDVRDFWAFSKAGRALADLHLNYEKVEPYSGVTIKITKPVYRVEKMRFIAKGQKDTIIYNDYIRIENIPEKAYRYIVNGKSAIEWIIERYAVTTDKASGIKNDPNDWSKETGKPTYILDLLLSIINVSVQTVDIVDNLPHIKFE